MTWAGVGLSIGCLYIALRGTDLRAIGSTLAGAHLWFVLPLVAAQSTVLRAQGMALAAAPETNPVDANTQAGRADDDRVHGE